MLLRKHDEYQNVLKLSQGHSYVYAKTHMCSHMDHKYWKFLSQFGWIPVLCEQNLCAEPILISLNPILTELLMMFVSPPHRHAPINAK